MLSTWVTLVAGIAAAGIGGELFVRGTIGLAQAARISPGIIAATIAAFATSSPELTVAVNSALAGEPEISFGNVLGANVVNVALIIGVVLLMAAMTAPRGTTRRDLPVAMVVPMVLAALLADGSVSRLDGLVLLAGFLAWLVAVMLEVRAQRSAAGEVLGEPNLSRAVIEGLAGLGLLVAAGKLIVTGASGLARTFGLSEFVIGATVVAIGTTIPELVTAVIARLKGHDEVGLGTVLGSNIFNGLFIVGLTAVLAPIRVPFATAAPALVLGLAAVSLTLPARSGRIDRWRGGILLGLYAVYLVTVLQVP
jgi:cation:H+ antiporter